jgi:hypothetical protein
MGGIARELRMSPTTSAADRRHFILHHGILRYGLVLGLLVFAFVAQGEYGTALERLATPAGWLRLLLLLLLCLGEWTLAAGWLIGRLLWFLHNRPLPPRVPPSPRHG